jgi:pantetheine-phosphate adenylyltransferase
MTRRKFNTVATGGTFDELHVGHLALLSKAFEISNKVIIGVSSDEFAAKVKGKRNLNHDYEQRVRNLKKIIRQKFGGNINYSIVKLNTEFGPTVTHGSVDALIASTDTANKGIEINKIRTKNSLNPLAIVAVDIVKAADGSPISSTRIRDGEIDPVGKILKSK